MKNFKFFLSAYLLIIWLIGSFLNVIFYLTDYNDMLLLEQINYQYATSFKFANTLEKGFYTFSVKILRVVYLLTSLLIAFCFIRSNWVKQELVKVFFEFVHLLRRMFHLVRQLSKIEKGILVSVIILIVLIRVYYLCRQVFTTDEVASFDLFVMEGPLAVVSFYPFPNNHILSNFLSLLYYQVHTDPLFVMRVPTFLVGLVGTLVIYVVLLRFYGHAIAILSIVFLSFSEMGMFYSIAGRGYFLILLMAFLNFFSMLSIMYHPGKHNLYWLLFILSGIFGFFTVPTFLYPFAATCLIGLLYSFFKRDKNKVLALIASGVMVGLGCIALYLPLIFISGIESLINNKYVQPKAFTSFWSGFIYYFSYAEGLLLGHERSGEFIISSVLLLVGVRVIYFDRSKQFLKFELPLLVMVLSPYLFMVMQRVYLPERALFYKSIYLYIILSALFLWLLDKINVSKKFALGLAGLGVILYSIVQVYNVQKSLISGLIEEEQREEAFLWLKQYKPDNIIVLDPMYKLYLNHYFKIANLKCGIYSAKIAEMEYDYIVLPKSNRSHVKEQNLVLGEEMYQNDNVQIYSLKGY